ncbi:MAG: hypothetical protein IKE31_08135 [Eubacterium sp.]|nr:hypothetical protein [Eubacterium sp.]
MDQQKRNIFFIVKQSVTPWQAASFYGLKPDRNGMCRCPFHDDHTPSLKLYNDHYYCFGCGASGDVIDLTGKLLGLSPKETADRLCQDFGIYPDDVVQQLSMTAVPVLTPTVTDRATKHHMPRDQPGSISEAAAVRILLDLIRVTEELMAEYAPVNLESDWNAVFTFAMEHHTRAEILLDVLTSCDRDILPAFLEEHGPELMSMKSFICWYDRRKELLYERKLQNRSA